MEQIEKEREKLRRIQAQRREQRRRDQARARELAAEADARAARARRTYTGKPPQEPQGQRQQEQQPASAVGRPHDTGAAASPHTAPYGRSDVRADAHKQNEEAWRRRVSAAKALRRRHYMKVGKRRSGAGVVFFFAFLWGSVFQHSFKHATHTCLERPERPHCP